MFPVYVRVRPRTRALPHRYALPTYRGICVETFGAGAKSHILGLSPRRTLRQLNNRDAQLWAALAPIYGVPFNYCIVNEENLALAREMLKAALAELDGTPCGAIRDELAGEYSTPFSVALSALEAANG